MIEAIIEMIIEIIIEMIREMIIGIQIEQDKPTCVQVVPLDNSDSS